MSGAKDFEKQIAILEVLYNLTFTVNESGNIAYQRAGAPPTPAEETKINALLGAIKTHKPEAIAYLRSRQTVEDALPAIIEAAADCERAARRAEKQGDLNEARRLWVQFSRFWQAIEPEPEAPWSEFISIHSGKSPVDSGKK